MPLYDVMFYIFATLTILSAAIVVFSRNIMYSAYALFLTLFSIAGLYVLLSADFIAVVQLIVYAGGILILLLFGVMLTSDMTTVPVKTNPVYVISSTVGVGLLAGVLYKAVNVTNWTVVVEQTQKTDLKTLGFALMGNYSLLYVVLGIFLLAALIGAASLARK